MIITIRDETNPSSNLYDKHRRISQITKINKFPKNLHHADALIQSLDLKTVQSYAQEILYFITDITLPELNLAVSYKK